MKIGILGGGLSGLTLGNLLTHDSEILEKQAECGGLCRTIEDQGFTFDYGGCHILFSKDKDALDFMLDALGDNKLRNKRNNKIMYKGRYVKYPFENGLHGLPLQDNFECLDGYVRAMIARAMGEYGSPRNFKEWCLYTFGQGIADNYLIPYNEKIWKFLPEAMSAHWVDGRVPLPPVEDVIKSSLGIETEGYLHQLYYFYPRRGGTQALIRGLETSIAGKITTNFCVTSLSRCGTKWEVSDGSTNKRFDQVVSTVPLFDLARAVEHVPEDVREALQALRHNRLVTVLLGIDMAGLSDLTAAYIPDGSVLPHRLGFMATFSPYCVPEGKSSILAEITCGQKDEEVWGASDSAIVNRVVDDVCRLGILGGRGDVCYSRVERSEYAYVVYDLDYQRKVEIVKNFFQGLGIILLGRFSEFEYLNMDACVRRAMSLADVLNHKGEAH